MTTRGNWNGWTFDRQTLELIWPPRGYIVDVERMTTSAAVLDMVVQVGKKTWATDACLAGLVRALNALLVPQAYLCSCGSHKTMSTAELSATARGGLVMWAPKAKLVAPTRGSGRT
jgi:hypothetical protein